jgi:hypothetical protein
MDVNMTPADAASAHQLKENELKQAKNARQAVKRTKHLQAEAKLQQTRMLKQNKRKAENDAKQQVENEVKKVKKEAKAVKSEELLVARTAARCAKSDCGVTLRLDQDALITHIQSTAGKDAKISINGQRFPNIAVSFETKAQADAFRKRGTKKKVSLDLVMRTSAHPERMLQIPKDGLGNRVEALAGLKKALDALSMSYAWSESYGPNLGVQFNTTAEAALALARFNTEGFVINGVDVGAHAIMGLPKGV